MTFPKLESPKLQTENAFKKQFIFDHDTIESHEIQTDEDYEKVRHYVSN